MNGIPTTMRAAITRDWNDICIEQVPVPALEPGEVLVRVGACGICGTDLKIVAGVYKGSWPPSLPFIQGHEWAGTVAALGEGVTGLQVGDRVAAENHKGCGTCANCRRGRYNLCEVARSKGRAYKLYGHSAQGAFAEYAARPAGLLHKLSDTVSLEEGTIVNQGALGLHAIRRCRIEPGDTVAVIGPGLVGLITVQLAKAVGATRVIIIGRGPRLELAKELGADDVVDISKTDAAEGIRSLTDGRGVDCAFECAGAPQAVVASINGVKRGGRVALVGLTGNKEVSFNTDRIALDEVDVFGVRSSPNAYPELINLIAAGKVNVRKLISRLYPLEQINDAFDAFRKREGGAIRMVIQI
ncbi:MAG TPA: alcohol dehydrogenase catalytic domain-containing protein [Anaerolineales bacterium]|nr:alcohol dehydrogenase catalytic domain-containing protein [Anaerolineales bacterium]